MSKSSQVDQDLIKAIATLLNEEDLAEIEIEQDDFRVRVTRSFGQQYTQVSAPAAPPAPAAPAAPAPAAASEPTSVVGASSAAADDIASNPGTLTSPMVGTAYLAPEPGAAPYMQVGSQVSEGQTVLIVEAMKTMNQIPAHRSGKITRILVEDAQPVEYGEPLVVIE